MKIYTMSIDQRTQYCYDVNNSQIIICSEIGKQILKSMWKYKGHNIAKPFEKEQWRVSVYWHQDLP